MMKRFGSVLAVLMCALTPGCFSLDEDGDGLIDLPPSPGDETNELTCSDGRDNDGDGRIDCQDSDCLMRGFCGEQIPLVPHFEPENTPEACTDGIDNDQDGQFDCGDRECQGIMELCCNTEVDNVSCSNRLDDDGNGYADCTDFSCRNNQFVEVCESETQCVKFDQEGNLIPCTAAEAAAALEEQCQDRFDNDGDRRTDCNDPDCACTEVCNPGCAGSEDTVEKCSDGFDNDGNGFTDCGDFSCSMSPVQAVADLCARTDGEPEDSVETCTDGIDNDGNGFTDCADRSCFDGRFDPPTGAAVADCQERQENTPGKCSDGLDNDGNGFVDCDDNSCRFSTKVDVRKVCEATVPTCSDRRDNNDNGFIDCADFSCRFYECNQTSACGSHADCPSGQSCFAGACIRVTSPCMEGAYMGGGFVNLGCPSGEVTIADQQAQVRAGCTDGVDGDQDGFVDCDDWDCAQNPLAVNPDGTRLCPPLLCR